MEPALVAILIAGIFSAGTLGMTFFTLRSNQNRDAIILTQNASALLQKANADTVQSLERRISLLEDENKDLRHKVDECHEARMQLMETNNELMQRVLGIAKSPRRTRSAT